MVKWQTLKSEYVYKTPFGNLRSDACKLPNGQIIERYYVNEYPDWVNAIVLTKEMKVVLVKQYRHGGEDFFLEKLKLVNRWMKRFCGRLGRKLAITLMRHPLN
ncbi:hypothetical protein J2S19_000275 [Metabacillus malikii]|uniref:NUDIX hydrolase n=1 Tax=Metabacillus malikii TaxID=1504265 RepID=A0ABT9ZCN5_9BACI|nr:hypothetical protein [Metabacillus malikii]